MTARNGLLMGLMLLGGAVITVAEAQHAMTTTLPAAEASADSTVRKAARTTKSNSSFTRAQLQNQRVTEARYQKKFAIKQLFRSRGIAYPAEQVFLRIFKRERILELWARPAGQDTFAMVKSYEICALTDKLGPKRKQGDLQTPEGFYYIDDFNPRSGFHLSLHIDYPNKSDRALGRENLGGDIFIHGGCKTEGCLAVTDESIKEIYWIAVEARDNGQTRIPVHIFPTRLNNNNLAQLTNVFAREPDLIRFWNNLKVGYDYFVKHKRLPEIEITAHGRYRFFEGQPLLGQPLPKAAVAAQSDSATGN